MKNPSKSNTANSQLSVEYNMKQLIQRNYIAIMLNLHKIVNQLITAVGINWLRKVKWLYTFVLNLFVNFDIRGSQFHESIAKEYSKLFVIVVQIVTNYMVTFKNGLFPLGKLNDLAFQE